MGEFNNEKNMKQVYIYRSYKLNKNSADADKTVRRV